MKDKREEKQAILGELESIKDLLNEDDFADIPTLDDSINHDDIPVLTLATEDLHDLNPGGNTPILEPSASSDEEHLEAVNNKASEDYPPLLDDTAEEQHLSQTAAEWQESNTSEHQAADKAEAIYSELLSNIETTADLPDDIDLNELANADIQADIQTDIAADTEANIEPLQQASEALQSTQPLQEEKEAVADIDDQLKLTGDQEALLDSQITAAEEQLAEEQQHWRNEQLQESEPETKTEIEVSEAEIEKDIDSLESETTEVTGNTEEDATETDIELDAQTESLPPLSQAPHALPGQQSLFDGPQKDEATSEQEPLDAPQAETKTSKKSARSTKASATKARGENPFLPKHIRDRLHTNKPLVDIIKEHPPVPELHAHPTNHVVEAVLAEFMPKIEAELRERLLKLADEDRLDEEKPL